MSRRLIIILISLALVLLMAMGLFFFLSQKTVTPTEPIQTQTVANNNQPISGVNNQPSSNTEMPLNYSNQPVVAEKVDDKTQVKNVAARFAEKYGTYSTDANFANLKNLAYLLTDTMRLRTQNVINANSLSQNVILPFYGVTTKVVIVQDIKMVTLTQAVVNLTTQRSETFSRAGEPQLRYQDIKVYLEKVNDRWLISDAEWINGNQLTQN
ncbi:MAG: hypothetical protein HY973_00390 [Candidatus Kerfeldbacteria bacterium]|nr:hypothetical protein [Candidatus Kerfeldbacteria bacterium]